MPWMPCGRKRPPGEHRRLRRLDRDDLHARELVLQDLAHAGDASRRCRRPATNASRRPSTASRISSAVVRRWISGFAGFWNCCGMKYSGCSRTSSSAAKTAPRHALDGGREVDLGAEAREEPLALDAHVLRHGEDQPVALHRRDHRQPDAGVAAGRLHDGGARLEHAAALGVLDHRHGDPVLHAAAGVARLDLGEHARARRARAAAAAAPAACHRSGRAPSPRSCHAMTLALRCDTSAARSASRRSASAATRSPSVQRSTTRDDRVARSPPTARRGRGSRGRRCGAPGRCASNGALPPSTARSTAPTVISSGALREVVAARRARAWRSAGRRA